ncbi:methylenetetrahydrofolate reductase [Thalassobaculum fulvum]|uniref:methylenetetrahydrofolate reductase (NADH) n=1 Tax=Thalassobaculum fulvum TaxID=1633335 RepID=A0A918XNL6_9PROT|nr:methylenetetrahydrofolate reductase [Thalassobaculum fulvum]GHD42432.1 methylenetetrahydrofolate reductase [Thalassobaculum fulvum]
MSQFAVSPRASAADVVALMRDFSVETTPTSAAKVASFADHLAAGTTVNVTFLPGSDPADTVAVARRLRAEGFEPVPHVAARSLADRATLDRYLGRLGDEAGVTQALVIAGGVDKPVGAFASSMDLLATGLFQARGITRIGVAGHPEGTPDIAEPALRDALLWKNRYAAEHGLDMYIETQFCFDAAAIAAWDRRIRGWGNRLPIHLGVPGLATLKTLLKFAQSSGVGPSIRVLTRQARNIAKLMLVQAPDRLVVELAACKALDPECGIEKLHFYPFGGLAKTAEWANAVAAGRFAFDERGTGLVIGEQATLRAAS